MNNAIPNISLGEYGYEGTIEIQAWNEFSTSLGEVYGLDIGGDMVEDDPTITQEHINAYNYAIKNQNNIRDSIIRNLMEKYPGMQSEYGYDEDEAEEFMPDIKNEVDFKNLIGLSKVHIMNVYKNGLAYTGYEFTCTWDDEHGFGVMMHEDNIVETGGADMSFLTWVAEKDMEE